MNSAYKHLDTKLKFAELTITQWFMIMLGVLICVLWCVYISPFGTYLTLGTGVYIGAIPAGLALMSTFYEVDVAVFVAAAVRWSRLDGRFVPGPGPETLGYLVQATGFSPDDGDYALATLDPAALWE